MKPATYTPTDCPVIAARLSAAVDAQRKVQAAVDATRAARDLAQQTLDTARAFKRKSKAQAAAAALAEQAETALEQAETAADLDSLSAERTAAFARLANVILAQRLDALSHILPAAPVLALALRSTDFCATYRTASGSVSVRLSLVYGGGSIFSAEVGGERRLATAYADKVSTCGTWLNAEEARAYAAAVSAAADIHAALAAYAEAYAENSAEDYAAALILALTA